MIKSKKIKVLHVLHAVGGVDVHLRLLLETTNHDKFQHIIIKGTNDNSNEYFQSDGKAIKVYKLPIAREISFVKDLTAIVRVIKIFRNEKPDIVHAHSSKGGIIARTASMFYKVNVLHTPHAYSYLSADSVLKRKLFLAIEKFYKNINSILLATSNSEANRGIIDIGYKEEKVFVFNNSTVPIENLKEMTFKKYWPDNYICSVGRPSYQKNIELMLEVLKEIKNEKPDIHLVLMGVGLYSPNLKNVENIILEYNLQSNITLLRWIEREDIFNILSESTLYLSTARYEGLPYAIIESLSLGKPVVATDVDGNRDLVIDNYNGYLVKNENVKELADKILSILNDSSKISKFSFNSSFMFHEKFNLKRNISILEDIYERNL